MISIFLAMMCLADSKELRDSREEWMLVRFEVLRAISISGILPIWFAIIFVFDNA